MSPLPSLTCSLFLLALSVVSTLSAPASTPEQSIVGTIYPKEGVTFEYDTVGLKPGHVKLHYRAQHPMDGQRPLDPLNIIAAATAFQDRLAGDVTAGKRTWTDYLDDRAYTGDRDIEANGIFIFLEPPAFIGRTTLERAYQVLEGMKMATVDKTTLPPNGPVEEARIASSVIIGQDEFFVCNVRLGKDTPANLQAARGTPIIN